MVLKCVSVALCFILYQQVICDTVSVSGADFPSDVYQAWSSAYISQDPSISVEYSPTSSGTGRQVILAGEEVFIGSEIVYGPEEYAQVPDIQMLPFLGGAVVAVALDFTGIVVDRETLADMFMGKINFWDDPKITNLNPFVNFPHEFIRVIYEDGPRGVTESFTRALAKFSPEWNSRFGVTNEWPEELRRNTEKYISTVGEDGKYFLATVIPFSISYLPIYFVENSLASSSYLRLIDQEGKQATCSRNSIAAAIAGATFDDRFNADIADLAVEGAWPISTISYIVLRKESTDPSLCEQYWDAIKFLNFGLTFRVPSILVGSNEFALPSEDVQSQIISILQNCKCNGEARFRDGIPFANPFLPTVFIREYSDSSFHGIETITYAPYYDEFGNTIPSSEASDYDPTTISSLFSPNIVFERYYRSSPSSIGIANVRLVSLCVTVLGLLFSL